MTQTNEDDATQSPVPREVKPWGWHSGDGTPAHPAFRVEQWPKQNRSRMTEPVFDQAALDAAVGNALDEREFIHAGSSLIYARLATAVRAGCADEVLGKLLREEVAKRGEQQTSEARQSA